MVICIVDTDGQRRICDSSRLNFDFLRDCGAESYAALKLIDPTAQATQHCSLCGSMCWVFHCERIERPVFDNNQIPAVRILCRFCQPKEKI